MTEAYRSVATIRKNSKEEIRIGFDTYKDRDLFSIRVWFIGDDGEMHPGKGGLAFSVERLVEFSDAIARAADEERG